jgi:3-dehydroquinate synthetase
VRDLVNRDKKMDERGSRMVLLRAIGDPFVTHAFEDDVQMALGAIGI